MATKTLSRWSRILVAVVILLSVSGVTAMVSNGQTTNDYTEPNDDFDTATDVQEEDNTFQNLQIVNGESDFFAYDLQRGDTLDVTTEFNHETGDLDLAIYSPGQTRISGSRSITDDESASITADRNGTYYVEVYGYSGASAPYTVEFEYSSESQSGDGETENDGNEPNNDFTEATVVEAGSYDNLQIVDGESDFFAVDLQDNQSLDASIDFAHSSGDLDMELYGPDQTYIDGSFSISDGESVSVSDSQSGTYYIEVYGYSGDSATYSLEINRQQGDDQDGGEGTTSESEFCDRPPLGPYDITLSPKAATGTNAYFTMNVTPAGGNYEYVGKINITTSENVRVRRVVPLSDTTVLERIDGTIALGLVDAANPSPIPISDLTEIASAFQAEQRENSLSNVNRVGLDLRGDVPSEGVQYLVWVESSSNQNNWTTPSTDIDRTAPVTVSYVAEREPLPSETDYESDRTTNIFCMDFSTEEY